MSLNAIEKSHKIWMLERQLDKKKIKILPVVRRVQNYR